MGLLNEIRLWNQKRLVNLYTIEIDENVKRDKTIDFVALLNMWDFELNSIVESNKTSNLYTFEIDENVKRDKTVEFVTWLNMWDYWMRHEWEIR